MEVILHTEMAGLQSIQRPVLAQGVFKLSRLQFFGDATFLIRQMASSRVPVILL